MLLEMFPLGQLRMSNHDTDALSEGSNNLYHTNARARGAISVTDSGDGSLAHCLALQVLLPIQDPVLQRLEARISAGTGATCSKWSNINRTWL